jgi:DNA-binding phage protein
VKTKTFPYDAAEYLRDEADCVAYLQAVIQDNDDIASEIADKMLADALGAITRALVRIKAERNASRGT